MRLGQVVAVAMFVAVATGSPGPNNTLLLASGMTFGLRRTMPHVLGTTLGMAVLVGVSAAGAGAVIAAVPGMKEVLKAIASAYLIYLAARLAGGVALDPVAAHDPFSVAHAIAFQFVNPKALIFAVALVSVLPPARGTWIAVGLTATGVGLIVAATAVLWAIGGTTLGRVLEGEWARRVAGIALAVLLLASVVLLWV